MTKVECSWDQADESRERKLTSYHKWHEMDEDDLAVYLASSSDEEEEVKGQKKGAKDKEHARKKTRAMLLGGLVEGKEIL